MNINTVTTKVIVIKKNLFKESSFIVTGFAPELGKINVIFKVNEAIAGRKNFLILLRAAPAIPEIQIKKA